jgi:hypothetical protein
MPGLQTVLSKLNTAFGRENIKEMVKHRDKFEPGKPLAAGIVVTRRAALFEFYASFINSMPKSMQEALLAIIRHALGTSPPTPITFSWAPAYDYELTVWHAPDTRNTRGGITVLLKSRYPDDKHPLADEPPYGSEGRKAKKA